jgi:hypothetical protein
MGSGFFLVQAFRVWLTGNGIIGKESLKERLSEIATKNLGELTSIHRPLK